VWVELGRPHTTAFSQKRTLTQTAAWPFIRLLQSVFHRRIANNGVTRGRTAPTPHTHGFGQPVAEIRFDREAQARDRAAVRERERFAIVDVRRMHEAPARVDVEAIEQPLHGPRAERREAGVDFRGLLRYVDVYRRAGRYRIEP
jgi:hypothetical protein